MKIEDFDNFFLGTSDLNESRIFYQDMLGLAVKFDFSAKGMIAFTVGDNEPAIILKDTALFPAAKPTIWFKVDSVLKCYEELTAKGLHFSTAPYKIQTGWAVEFSDPAGNVLGFTDYLP